MIQQAFRIPQASLGSLGHHVNCFRLDVDRFLFGDPSQMLVEGIERNASEIKALATAEDRRQHPLRVGGGQYEDHLWWRFLQGFQQGVEGCSGEHVALVHHIYLPAGLHRCEAGAFD